MVVLGSLWLAWAAPAQAAEREVTVGVSAGGLHTHFRDQQVTPRRHGGWGPAFGLAFDTITETRLDRLALTYHWGSSGGWSWQDFEYDVLWAPRIVGSGDKGVFVGIKGDVGVVIREWRTGTWQGNMHLGAAVGGRWGLLERKGHRLWAEASVSAPLVGAVGRPGYGTEFQGSGMSLQDWSWSSLHNHLAMDGSASLLWLRPSGSHLRLELRTLDQRISVRHPVTRSQSSLHLIGYWSL